MTCALGFDLHAAHAEHDHGAMAMEHDDDATAFTAGVGLVAADVDTAFYTGDYQGVGVTGGWQGERLGVGVGVTGYRLNKNGRAIHGPGDVDLHAQYAVLVHGAFAAGAALAVTLPTGSSQEGLGMGHLMAMPAAFARFTQPSFALSVVAGYGRALGGDAENAHAMHGGGMEWPIVAPMYVAEVTAGVGGELVLAKELRASGRVEGALPTGQGELRSFAALGVAWTRGRIATTAEMQAGLTSEPFGIRGVIQSAVRF